MQWLNENGTPHLSASEINTIKQFLLKLRPEQTVLHCSPLVLDTGDLVSLISERYVTGFCINVVCMKYQELARAQNKHNAVFLPSVAQTWLTSSAADSDIQERLTPFLSNSDPDLINKVLMPIHVNNCHWGLLYLDGHSKTALYDDGLKTPPPPTLNAIAKRVLSLLSSCCVSSSLLDQSAWDYSFCNFGMPKQPSSGIGSASCGVGVIMCVRDIILSGNKHPKFSWSFDQMGNIRKDIIHSIIEWSNIQLP